MLGEASIFGSASTNDMVATKDFYVNTLGLAVAHEKEGEMFMLSAGGSQFMVYNKEDHAPAAHTVLNFSVDDVSAAADALIEKGVTFEKYDGMEMDERGVMTAEYGQIAWFKDPAGNTLSLVSLA